jgi:hypothetical protein
VEVEGCGGVALDGRPQVRDQRSGNGMNHCSPPPAKGTRYAKALDGEH